MTKRLFNRISNLISGSPGSLLDRARGHIKYLNLMRKNEILRFYRRVKYEKHIFIFSVLGRSSSTAFQRILNSSGEICIFGETKGSLSILLEAYNAIEQQWHMKSHWNDLVIMKHEFKTGRHIHQYPNALNLEPSYYLIPGIIVGLFRPFRNVKRFGCKDIQNFSLDAIGTLKRLFPSSRIVFFQGSC